MNRLYIGIRKELRLSRATIMFHIIAILSPLMFLFLWTVTLSQDISLATAIDPGSVDSEIVSYIAGFSSPRGIPYSRLLEAGKPHQRYNAQDIDLMDTLVVRRDFLIDEDGISGEIDLVLNNINANMTKNYRNRLVGAVSGYVEEVYLRERAISVEEETVFPSDILWKHYFSMTLTGLAILFSGLMFGTLTFTAEWSSGGMTALALSPVSSLWVLGGKLLAGYIKGAVAISVYFFAASLLNPGMTPDIGLLTLTVLLFYTFVFIVGMIIGLLLREPIISFVVVLILSIVLWIFSGGFGTSILMAEWLKNIVRFLPSLYAFRLMEYAFFGGFEPAGAIIVLVASAGAATLIMILLFHLVTRSGKELSL